MHDTDALDSFSPRDIKRPAITLAALFVIGLSIARYGPSVSSIIPLILAFACAIIVLFFRRKWTRYVLALAVMLGAHGWYTLRIHEHDSHSLIHRLDTPTLLTLEGTVLTPPTIRTNAGGQLAAFDPRRKPTTRFQLEAFTLIDSNGDRQPVSGTLWVRIDEPMNNLHAGDDVRVQGMADGLEAPLNPGERDMRIWSAQRGIVGRIQLDSAALVQPIHLNDGVAHCIHRSWLRSIEWLRRGAQHWLDESSDRNPSHALTAALLLGQRDDAMNGLEGAFNRLGLAHVLSVSGFHLGVFALFLVLAVRVTGEHPRLEPIVLCSAILVYLMLIPAQAPIVRAGVMTLVLLLAETCGRRYDRLNTLALVMIALLIWRPADFWDVGFQLSFASVAALLTWTLPLRTRLFGPRPNPDDLAPFGHLVELLKSAITASIVAWSITAPLVAWQLGVFSPIAPIATLIVLPLASLLIGAGYLALLLSLVIPASSGIALPALNAIASVVTWLVERLDTLPVNVVYLHHNGVNGVTAIGATLVIWWWMTRGTWRDIRGVVATILAAGLIAYGLAMPTLPRDVELRLDSLAVGNGSCHLVRSGREAMLYDCGSDWYRIGERDIPQALRALGSPPVRTVVISHPDTDHYSGLLDVIESLGVRRVLTTHAFLKQAKDRPRGVAAYVVRKLEHMGVSVKPISAGDTWLIGDATVRVLAPEKDSAFEKDNDGSAILLVSANTQQGERRVLFTGDIGPEGIKSLTGADRELHAEVMESPHHGSANADAIRFVSEVDPRIVVQSTGRQRIDDPRWVDVRAARQWFTTAKDGAISVTIWNNGNMTAQSYRANDR